MAPEVFMRTKTGGHGRAADIWIVGCVVIEMATGKVIEISESVWKTHKMFFLLHIIEALV
jgi:serine/threonine protein kinase